MIELANQRKIRKAAADYLMEEGFETKVNLEGYPKPPSLSWEGKENLVIPDLTATLEDKTFVFKITATRLATKPAEIENWKLLSAFAAQKGASLYLITEVKQKTTILNIARKAGLTPGILTVKEK